MSDLTAANCGCGEERCGCGCEDNNYSCSNRSGFGNNSCSWILWIIILSCFCNNNNSCGSCNNHGCGNNDCTWLIIILLFLCGGCGNGNGCLF